MSLMKLPTTKFYLRNISLYIFLGLLAYMPLHIFLSTWIGTSFGVLEFAKVAKEGLLVIGFLITLGLSVRKPWFRPLLRDKLLWAILAYVALTLVLAAFKPTDQDAEILGVVYNTRYLLFLLYAVLLTHLFPEKRIKWLAIKTVIYAGVFVVLFGIVQYFFLPNDALTRVGYTRENGVLPAFFIDDKPDLERVMSTIRDPNSLGSYLIIVTSVVMAILLSTRRLKTRHNLIALYSFAIACLWLTFSRSALLGFALATLVFVALSEGVFHKILKARQGTLLAVAVIAVLTGAVSLFMLRDNYFVQNVVFHADEATVQESPNELRIRFWQESVVAAIIEPEGSGPGTAGLASIKNDKQGTVLNENYYLQILTEVGVLGLVLFLLILALVAIRLYEGKKSLFALALLASFIGLGFTNFLVHIWSNEAVAYTWWGLAGLTLAHYSPPLSAQRAKLMRIGWKVPRKH
jgi:putative inorganic carbon (HCO3(-)) transporter